MWLAELGISKAQRLVGQVELRGESPAVMGHQRNCSLPAAVVCNFCSCAHLPLCFGTLPLILGNLFDKFVYRILKCAFIVVVNC
jgi:hypothetical protein